ncbi:MAG: hypothetical protein LBQ14_09405 [Treponema sp.]|nr:hypothetical protein [Treponema sp.]
MQTVVAIPRAIPILHSGPGCGSMAAGFFERSRGYSGGGTAPCTNFTESDVVFGGEKQIGRAYCQFLPDPEKATSRWFCPAVPPPLWGTTSTAS